MKRLFELLLLALASPLLLSVTLALALVVLVRDGRPVLFTQWRLGRGRRPFRIFKLRTMADGGPPARPRPTRLGEWLRERGLDELPQLLNVLRGEMSLVGPRPWTAEDADRLLAGHPLSVARFVVPPGLTGLSQVCLVETPASSLPALTAELDAFYARRRTVRMDLWILARTLLMNVLGKRRGALRRLSLAGDCRMLH